LAHASAGFLGSEPAAQVKLAQVGGGGVVVTVVPGVVVTVVPGVVVTVEQGPLGVVVTGGVVVTVVPGVVVTVVPGVVVTVEQGALGVVVGGGVVVTVVTMLQHLCEQHFSSCAFPHMMTPPLGEKPAGHAYDAQVTAGKVVVTVVQGLAGAAVTTGAAVTVVQGLAGAATTTGANGATVPQGLPASTAPSKAKESNTFATAMVVTARKKCKV